MDTKTIQECFRRSHAGEITFPEIVKTFSNIGVERYHVDFIELQKTAYSQNDETYTEKFSLDYKPQQKDFNQSNIVQAIRDIQAGKTNYLQFLKEIIDNGVVGYWVFIDGKQAIYYGRKGEQHIERFPALAPSK